MTDFYLLKGGNLWEFAFTHTLMNLLFEVTKSGKRTKSVFDLICNMLWYCFYWDLHSSIPVLSINWPPFIPLQIPLQNPRRCWVQWEAMSAASLAAGTVPSTLRTWQRRVWWRWTHWRQRSCGFGPDTIASTTGWQVGANVIMCNLFGESLWCKLEVILLSNISFTAVVHF